MRANADRLLPMCYSVFLSTSSPEDLSVHSTARVKFQTEDIGENVARILLHEHKWFIGSQSGCSCTFRHLTSPELGFGKPEEWYPEEGDELAATGEFVAVVRQLLNGGHEVDCVDVWNQEAGGGIATRQVELSVVSDEEFRFFENFHFVFVGPATTA
jgi:hypothetical protein